MSEHSGNTPQSMDDIHATLQDMTNQIYHSLSLFEQLSVRLEARCTMLDGSAAEVEVDHIGTNQNIPPNYRELAPLIEDDTVTDILVNGTNQIYVERNGLLELSDITISSEEELIMMAREIADYCGRQIDAKHPLVDARLPDGSRVNIVTPPASIDGVTMSIRKFSDGNMDLDYLVSHDCMTMQMANFLRCCAAASVNIVVSGGTGSGKTTLLNAISGQIPEDERVVTIEDAAELKLPIPHVVRLESVQYANDTQKPVLVRDLVKNALRMRPNRIIVGEVRGPEAFDMIQAMNTGHDGSLTTIHANTPRDGLARIENMIGMADLGLPTLAIRKQLASAITIIVQVERSLQGMRYIREISEIVGIEGDVITMQDLFVYKEGVTADGQKIGQHKWSGVFPRHYRLNSELRKQNVLDMSM